MNDLWEFSDYRLDAQRRLLLKAGDVVPLPSKAFDILLELVRRRGEVVHKDDLMQAIWPDSFVEEANLSQNVHLIRKALGERAQDNRFVATLPGKGYSFVAQVRSVTVEEPAIQDGKKSEENVGTAAPFGSDHGREGGKKFPSARPRGFFSSPVTLLSVAASVGIAFLAVALASPVLARYFNNRGVALQKDGQLNLAIRNYQRAIRFKSNYAEAHYNLADAFEELPAYDKALDEYQKALEADPTLYEAYNNLARLYIKRRKDSAAALELLEKALRLNPQEPSVQYSLHKNYGWASLELHLYGQAETSLRSAIELVPTRGAAHCLLAKVLNLQGEWKAALKEWEACVAYPGQPEVEPEWLVEGREQLNIEAQP